jgi:hypothetical protein
MPERDFDGQAVFWRSRWSEKGRSDRRFDDSRVTNFLDQKAEALLSF